jgi:hypothetical protein
MPTNFYNDKTRQMILKKIFGILGLIAVVSCSSESKKNTVDNSIKQEDKDFNSSKPMFQKRFKEPDNTAVFTTSFVIIDKKEITEVYHNEDDGAWQFLSNDKFDDLSKVSKLVGLGQITKIDSTLFEISDLPMGSFAYRKFKGDKWIIEKQK